MTDDPWVNFFVILTVGANLATLGLWALALLARFETARDAWDQARDWLGPNGLAVAAIVALTAMAGSLYLSEGADLPPCKLCWYQRISMYSLAAILLVAAIRRDWKVKPYALTLALIGACISIYHYLIERFPEWESGASCDPSNPCSITWIWRLHYISIPLMACSAFVLIVTVLTAARIPEKAVR
ncbi:MAG: disulfide bond formation protein B [Acidimicrobiia bacterium]